MRGTDVAARAAIVYVYVYAGNAGLNVQTRGAVDIEKLSTGGDGK
jgi:hypothetical protein